jgi:hypothetical protein
MAAPVSVIVIAQQERTLWITSFDRADPNLSERIIQTGTLLYLFHCFSFTANS